MDGLISWLVRFVHVLGAVLWVGGFAFLAMLVLPRVAHVGASTGLQAVAAGSRRLLNWSGALTFLTGLVLIWRTRGYDNLMGGEWGGILMLSILLTLGLLYLSMARLGRLLREAETLSPSEAQRAGRLAMIGTVVGVLLLALMTRLLYAS